MELVEIAELTSLVLTLPTIILAIGVVWIWGPSAIRAWFQKFPTSHQWFIFGVAAGFTGSFFDNLYWAIPWTAAFLGYRDTWQLMEQGVYFNIPFRQGFGILAAYCHLKAAAVSTTIKERTLNFLLAGSFLAGLIFGLTLLMLRWLF